MHIAEQFMIETPPILNIKSRNSQLLENYIKRTLLDGAKARVATAIQCGNVASVLSTHGFDEPFVLFKTYLSTF